MSDHDEKLFTLKKGKKEPKAKAKWAGGRKALGKVWTGREDWALFQHLHPTASKPDWSAVATATGRDSKVNFTHTLKNRKKEMVWLTTCSPVRIGPRSWRRSSRV